MHRKLREEISQTRLEFRRAATAADILAHQGKLLAGFAAACPNPGGPPVMEGRTAGIDRRFDRGARTWLTTC